MAETVPFKNAGAYGRRDEAVVFLANQVMRLASKPYRATLKALIQLGMETADLARANAERRAEGER